MTAVALPAGFAIAVGLSADCFAVALGGGVVARSPSWLSVARVSLAFGIFQGIMPVLGWLLGSTVAGLIADYDHWVAFALLTIVGGRMIWESYRGRDRASETRDVVQWVKPRPPRRMAREETYLEAFK